MTDLRTAAQQALEACEQRLPLKGQAAIIDELNNLRAALAQQDEPLNLTDPAVQKRLATQWGYVPAAQAEPVEPVAWKQGNLVTFNEDPYPALGGLFVQFWDGEEVAARFYANDLKTLRQRCAKVNTAPPQRKPLPKHDQHCVDVPGYGLTAVRLVRAVERAHGIGEQS